MSIITTVVVCIILCVASMFFSNDANVLVLEPVEQMINKVEAIRDNPLVAMKMADEEFKREELKRAKENQKSRSFTELVAQTYRDCFRPTVEVMETVILEKTIIKLGSLLALGFGQAGVNIVSQNMQGSQAGINAMVKGVRVDCVIGNARIRDFSIANVVLQQKVMAFVNQVAEIVHGVANEFHGASNKNHGDTFLVIWQTSGKDDATKTRLAEMSVVAFSKILAAVHRSQVLYDYRGHPGMQMHCGSKFRVNITFGLHHGWAIEGAVGSDFKIDASYISPNVTIASMVEHATGVYAVSLIMTQAVMALCTKEMASRMRLIDKVTIKGSKAPIELYSMDLDQSSVVVDQPREFVWNSRQRYRAKQFLESEKGFNMSPDLVMDIVFTYCSDIAAMRARYTPEFLLLFSMGYQNYSQGEWKVAPTFLKQSLVMLGFKDGPSAALLRFMESRAFKPPEDWTGVHKLSDFSSAVG